MQAAPIPDMQKGIISLWFRDARKNEPPAPVEWPSGVWTAGTESMVPPDVFKVIQQPAFAQSIFYWNPYGTYTSGLGITLPIFQGPLVMMPSPPPFVTNEMHMMLTFGNPNQSYDYCAWEVAYPEVIEAVHYVPMLVTGPQWSVKTQPPPYAPWIMAEGKFKPATFVLGAPTPRPEFVPQSFIGVDKDGYLTICLQTDTRAQYKGYAFQLDKITEIRATASYYDIPPGELPDKGHWIKVPGYWDGYEFWHTDVSDRVMGVQPETFVIGGPPGSVFDIITIPKVSDGAWHHLLFSFDISGSVELTLESTVGEARPPPTVKTACKAWLALDDKNYDGSVLQHRFPMHDGFQLPLLPGMGSDATGFGPVSSYTRDALGLTGSNDILPRSCWIFPIGTNPRDNLLRFASSAGLWQAESTQYINKGDFNWFVWTGSIWTLYGDRGDWKGEVHPPRPTTPEPTAFDVPTYQCDGFSIPTDGHPIGIPASAYHLAHNTGMEMAELQIWANVTLDTSQTALRRLFVEEKIDPVTNEKRYTPANPSKAANVLGKPDILLHGTGNWQKGKNTGKAGVDDENKLKAPGQFDPISKIEPFKPEPELGK